MDYRLITYAAKCALTYAVDWSCIEVSQYRSRSRGGYDFHVSGTRRDDKQAYGIMQPDNRLESLDK